MTTLIVSNWKMNPRTLKEARRITQATKKAIEKHRGVRGVIAPPAVFLRDLAGRSRSKKVMFGAQNIHWEKEGSHTGEHSPPQMKEAGAKYVIIGHAERRALGETDEDVRKKVAAALDAKLTPILCFGESKRDEEGAYLSVLAEQLRVGLADVPKEKSKRVIVAYEPVWAIGAEAAMDAHAVHETALYIKKILTGEYGTGASLPRILYGGSVNEENASELLSHGEIDGFLVGRASADPEQVSALIAAAAS